MTALTVKPLALVTGFVPGNGTALVRRFAEGGYRVAMMARNADRLAALEAEIPDAIAVPCDVTDAKALERASRT
jgi:NADP-dependent 3-hydroxy acid dehydrogenase YdfG